MQNIKMSFCCGALTKSKQPCKMKVSLNTQPLNGVRLCHIHIKFTNNQIVSGGENVSQQLIQHHVQGEHNIINNLFVNTKRCSSKTKSGCRCTKKTSNESGVCHIHQKLMKKNEIVDGTDTLEEISDKIFFMIKSPSINYKIDRQKDNCFVCLEECEKKLSCGHFIHTHCLLDLLQSKIKKNYRVFESNNEYFIITNCLYCKQISIVKNIQMTDKLQTMFITRKKYDSKRNKMRVNNSTISYFFNELFLSYDTYETKKNYQQVEIEFMDDLKQLIFDNFATIVFDNYILQKNICKIPSKYETLNKDIILKNINNTIENTLYTKFLYNKIKNKLETFVSILENVINKIIQTDNIQDDLLDLVNIF